MGRRNQRGLELSFKSYGKGRRGGRWFKTIGGEPVYFGAGPGVSDRASYYKARDAYRAHMAEQYLPEMPRHHLMRIPVCDLSDQDLTTLKSLLEKAGVDPATVETRRAGPELGVMGVLTHMPPSMGEKLRAKMGQPLPPPLFESETPGVDVTYQAEKAVTDDSQPDDGVGIDAMAESYLAIERQRRDQTAADAGSLRRKDRLTPKSYRGIDRCIKLFTDFAKARVSHFDDAARVEQLLLEYRRELEQQVAQAKISPVTVNARTAYLSRFFQHLWSSRQIGELPRVLKQVTSKYTYKPDPKPLALADVQKLWSAAEGREQAILAIGLNCAAYAIEIADMHRKDLIQQGRIWYIARRRRKTGIPYKIKLWPVTAKLVREHADGKAAGDLLFVDEKGRPLHHPTKKSERDLIAEMFEDLTERAGVDARWSQLRDTTATHIREIGREMGAPGLEDQILAHAAGRKISDFYAEQAPAALVTTQLDQAIDQLWKRLKLKRSKAAAK